MGVNRSNTYRVSATDQKDTVLVDRINEIRINNPFYGLRRVQLALQLHYDVDVGINKLRRVSHTYNLSPKVYSRVLYIPPRDRGLTPTRIPNLIHNLEINSPNHVWCTDFTYLQFQGYTYYLSTLIDIYTKEIVGFHLSTHHNTELILVSLKMAIHRFTPPRITHSDQGSEYRSELYMNTLKQYNITPSNSAKSSPWENGFQESFYGKFKPELELHLLPFGSTFVDMYNYIANQIDYYNNHRIHTTILAIPYKYRQEYYYQQKLKQDLQSQTKNLTNTPNQH
jgi:putative transposase